MANEEIIAEVWQIIRRLGEGQEQLKDAQMRTEQAQQRTEQAQQRTEQAQQRTEEELQRTQEAQRRTEEALQRTHDEQQLAIRQTRASLEDLKQTLAQNTREIKEENKKLSREWGRLANKLGTILEDITAPNIERFAIEEFGFDSVQDLLVRVRRTSFLGPERQREFDVICTGPGKVIYAEMKSTPNRKSITELKAHLEEFFDFFPEYRPCELVGVYASWSLSKELRLAVSEAGLYGVTMGDDTMEIVARPASVQW